MSARLGVVISSFRRPKGLEAAIESVRAQTYSDWLAVIADDHSDDPEVERVITKAIGRDHRFYSLVGHKRYTTEEKRKTCSFAAHINTALDTLYARGVEATCYLIDDVVYHPERCAAHMDVLDSRPDVWLVWGEQWLVQYDANGTVICERKQVPEQGLGENTMAAVRAMMPRQNCINHCSATHRRTDLRWSTDARFWTQIDWILWKQFLAAGKTFHHIPVVGETMTSTPFDIGPMMNQQGKSIVDVVRARGGQ